MEPQEGVFSLRALQPHFPVSSHCDTHKIMIEPKLYYSGKLWDPLVKQQPWQISIHMMLSPICKTAAISLQHLAQSYLILSD